MESGGIPTSWEVRPHLPNGFLLNQSNGEIYGKAVDLQNWSTHTIWANNTGGGDYTESFRIMDQPPSQIIWSQ